MGAVCEFNLAIESVSRFVSRRAGFFVESGPNCRTCGECRLLVPPNRRQPRAKFENPVLSI